MDTKSIALRAPMAGFTLMANAASVVRVVALAIARLAARSRKQTASAAERWQARLEAGTWARQAGYEDWSDGARERSLRDATDAHDVERRQRRFEVDEVGAFRLSGWP